MWQPSSLRKSEMTAHAGTILHHVKNVLDDYQRIPHLKSILNWENGLDDLCMFPLPDNSQYENLIDVVLDNNLNRVNEIINVMWEVTNPVLKHYANRDEFLHHRQKFIRPKTSYYKVREKKFLTEYNHQDNGSGAPYTEKGMRRYHNIAQGLI